MKEMISKELFVDVLPKAKELLSKDGYEFETFRFDAYDNTIRATISKITKHVGDYGTGIHCPVNINIYELAHQCKEWASKQYYSVNSGWNMTHWGGTFEAVVYRSYNEILFSSSAATEPEAIFKACQWILDNKGAN